MLGRTDAENKDRALANWRAPFGKACDYGVRPRGECLRTLVTGEGSKYDALQIAQGRGRIVPVPLAEPDRVKTSSRRAVKGAGA